MTHELLKKAVIICPTVLGVGELSIVASQRKRPYNPTEYLLELMYLLGFLMEELEQKTEFLHRREDCEKEKMFLDWLVQCLKK